MMPDNFIPHTRSQWTLGETSTWPRSVLQKNMAELSHYQFKVNKGDLFKNLLNSDHTGQLKRIADSSHLHADLVASERQKLSPSADQANTLSVQAHEPAEQELLPL